MTTPNSTPPNFKYKDEDPITMYLIVKESLNMGVGKTAAQVGHAVQMLQIKYQSLCLNNQNYEIYGSHNYQENSDSISYYDSDKEDYHKEEIYRAWLSSDYRKVVLKANDKEFEKLTLLKQEYIIVIDNGLTEVEKGSSTVIGFWPMYKSESSKTIIKRLQTLK